MTDFGPEYTKINTCWKRDEKGKVIVGDWAQPEFQYLADLRLICSTEGARGSS